MPSAVKNGEAEKARESRMSSYLKRLREVAAAEGSQSAANDLKRCVYFFSFA